MAAETPLTIHVHDEKPHPPSVAQGANVPRRMPRPETLLALMKANGIAKTGHHSGSSLSLRHAYLARCFF